MKWFHTYDFRILLFSQGKITNVITVFILKSYDYAILGMLFREFHSIVT